jgi:predicted enzyme related to lactoylglutathione lyase
MSVLGLSHFMIQAKDLKATLHFYSKVMGLPLLRLTGTEDDPQFLVFKDIEISQRKGMAAIPDPDTASLLHIAFYVDNIEEIVKQMKKKGAEFFVPITLNKDGSKWAVCRDPDGNRIEVTTAPHF